MNNAADIRVLVSAAGGDLGQAIIKSLRISKKSFLCYGCDMDPGSTGKYFSDEFYPVPPANDAEYIPAINKICEECKIDVFIPASEQEIRAAGSLGNSPILPSGIPVVCQNAEFLADYGDKYTSMECLRGVVDLASFADGKNQGHVDDLVKNGEFPFIVKERRSSGSRQVCIVRSRQDLDCAIKSMDAPLVQEFIDGSAGEFSIGIFMHNDSIQAISFERKIGPGGASWDAVLNDDPDVISYGMKIADFAKPHGSINIQVRKGKDGIRLLEINPRFSSLSAARAISGFNDVEWSVATALGLPILADRQEQRQKIHFKRYLSEMVDFGDGFLTVPSWEPKI